ncbi:MAG: hypothetical protein A2V84_02230 [Chloroflexi bacterium RBG_16_70_13]|nr:MAG: hypothetical protein A2V84_02230 [Chloroflexi bacterium RBG_16_70_13]
MSERERRPPAERKVPYHIGVAIGLSTGAYALSLAAVTNLQIDHDRELIDDRRPVQDAIALLGAYHGRMAAELEEARTQYESGSQDYGVLTARLAELRADLERLGLDVGSIEGMTGLLPSQIRLPSVPSIVAPPAPNPLTPPPTHGKTGASGGG